MRTKLCNSMIDGEYKWSITVNGKTIVIESKQSQAGSRYATPDYWFECEGKRFDNLKSACNYLSETLGVSIN